MTIENEFEDYMETVCSKLTSIIKHGKMDVDSRVLTFTHDRWQLEKRFVGLSSTQLRLTALDTKRSLYIDMTYTETLKNTFQEFKHTIVRNNLYITTTMFGTICSICDAEKLSRRELEAAENRKYFLKDFLAIDQ